MSNFCNILNFLLLQRQRKIVLERSPLSPQDSQGRLLGGGISLPVLLDEGLMSKEEYVFEVVVCFVLALGFLVWLTWMDAFHDTQLPAVCGK